MRTGAALLRAVSVETSSALMGRAWRLVAPLTARHARVLGNLERAFPDLPERERRRIALRQWDNLGRVFAETLQIDRVAGDPDRIDFVMSPQLEERLRTHDGGLAMVSAHMANWEIVTVPARRLRRVAALYHRLSNPLSDAYVVDLRKDIYTGGLFSKGPRTPGRIMEWVRDGHAMAMLGDDKEARGVELRFFGMPMWANPFPAMVARRLGVPLIAGTATRLPDVRFRVEAIEIPVPTTDDPAADAAEATQAALDYFEARIRERPEEWMWALDVWRRPKQRRATAAREAVQCP